MSKRTGLGKGLGAFFGEEYGIESKKAATPEQEAPVSEDKGKNTENKTDRKQNLKDLEMVLPGSTSKKPAAKKKSTTAASAEKVKIVEVEKEKFLDISLIEPNREQPRKAFDEEQLNELTASVKEYGVLQPLLVQKKGDYYEIIAGERRWRAARAAGLKVVPVVIREYSRQQTMEIALIENVQRADLNPIEEARAYQMLVQEFGLKQEDVAVRVSKNRATITNSMRLLKLDDRIQDMLIEGKISGGHARALLSIEDKEQQYQLANKIIQSGLSVRETEKLVKLLLNPPAPRKKAADKDADMGMFYRDLEDKLKSIMGTKVIINKKDKNKGRIEIEYYSSAELERISELLQSLNA